MRYIYLIYCYTLLCIGGVLTNTGVSCLAYKTYRPIAEMLLICGPVLVLTTIGFAVLYYFDHKKEELK